MQLFRHLTANSIELKEYKFPNELSMMAYVVENENILNINNSDYKILQILGIEQCLKGGRPRRNTDGRIDIMARYEDNILGIVELKLGELTEKHLEQLEDYLKQRDNLLESKYVEDSKEEVNWIGILVGTGISESLQKQISDGKVLTEDNIPFAALTIKRYKSEDNQVYVITDTYFKKKFQRDYTKYKFNGKTLGKARLVLEVVTKYVNEHPDINLAELKKVFPFELSKHNLGVFAERNEAEERYQETGYKRYYIEPNDILKLKDSEIAVCNQWGRGNIEDFIQHTRNLGYDILET